MLGWETAGRGRIRRKVAASKEIKSEGCLKKVLKFQNNYEEGALPNGTGSPTENENFFKTQYQATWLHSKAQKPRHSTRL